MRLRPTATVFGFSFALLVAFCCLAANAQSGRRQAKPPSVAPVQAATPEPTPIPTPKHDENEINFLVGTGDRGASTSLAPISYHTAATQGCADQLSKRTSLAVDVSRREMTRGEAIAKAKAGKSTYVVLITLIADRMSASSSNSVDYEIDYVVFAPETAKVMASGRTYEDVGRKGPVSVGRRGGVGLPVYREELIRRAGAQAADRILKSLHLNDPPPTKQTIH
jgi:hypothetical protein